MGLRVGHDATRRLPGATTRLARAADPKRLVHDPDHRRVEVHQQHRVAFQQALVPTNEPVVTVRNQVRARPTGAHPLGTRGETALEKDSYWFGDHHARRL